MRVREAEPLGVRSRQMEKAVVARDVSQLHLRDVADALDITPFHQPSLDREHTLRREYPR